MLLNSDLQNGIHEMAGYAEYLDLIEAAIQNKG